mgnify:CR=1 FL=1
MRRRIAYHATDRPRAEGAGTIAALRSWEGSARRARARLAARDEAGGGERVGWEGHTPREPLHGDRLTESADEAVAAFWDLLKGERSAYEIGAWTARGPCPREPARAACVATQLCGGADAPGRSCPMRGGSDREVPVLARDMPRVHGAREWVWRVARVRGRSPRVAGLGRIRLISG